MISLFREAIYVFLATELLLILLEYLREKDVLTAVAKLFRPQYLIASVCISLVYLVLKPLIHWLFS